MRAPLRIRYPEGLMKDSDMQLKAMAEDQANDMNSYLQRLVKLIPGEAVTIQMMIQSMIKGVDPKPCSYQYLPFVGLVVVLIVRIFGTLLETEKSKWDVEWASVIVATISYIIWIYATGGQFPHLPIPDKQGVWVGVAVMLWTFAVPYFYRSKSTNQ